MKIGIHCRNIGDDRDWAYEKWEQLVENLDEVIAVGSLDDFCPNCVDKRSNNINESIEAISDCDIVVGGSSGCMHLATLCEVPVLVWGDPGFLIPEIGTSLEAYTDFWNPLDTPVAYLQTGWDPSVETVLSVLNRFINRLEEKESAEKTEKLKELNELPQIVQSLKQKGTVGLVNGVFDLLHDGHKHLVKKAGEQCDYLIALLNTDASTKRLKGPERPVWHEYKRVKAMADLAEIDYIALFDDDWPEKIINTIDPDIIFKGNAYKDKDVAGSEERELVLIPELDDMSTTKILEDLGVENRYCHMFWASSEFSYLNYLAVKTAYLVHQPKKLFIWTYFEPSASNYWNELKAYPGIEVKRAESLFDKKSWLRYFEWSKQIYNEMIDSEHKMFKPAQISDMVAWRALNTYGGLYLDIDVVSYKPLWEAIENAEKDFVVGGFPGTGVLAVKRPYNSFLQKLISYNEKQLNQPVDSRDNWSKWTMFGPTAFKEVAGAGGDKFSILPSEYCYKWCKQRDLPFTKVYEEGDLKDVKVLHFYGAGRVNCDFSVNEVTPEFIEGNTVFAHLVKKALNSEELKGFRKAKLENNEFILETNEEVGIKTGKDGAPFVALGSIMKNEAHHIEDCFSSLLGLVDAWVVIDTGSTDNSVEVARNFFEKHGIENYSIPELEWKGFRPMRDKALELATETGAEYIMKMDLDEVMVNATNLRRVLESSEPKVVDVFCTSGCRFSFPRVWHRDSGAHWVENIHEIIGFSNVAWEDRMVLDPEICSIKHEAHEERPPELERTCALLRASLDENPDNARMMFYLARECWRLSDMVDKDYVQEAIYWFEKRIEAGKWWEEKFFAQLYLGDILISMQPAKALEIWEKAGKLCNGIAREPFLRLADWHYKNKDWDKAIKYYEKALAIKEVPKMQLFIRPDLYKQAKTDFILGRLAAVIWRVEENEEGAKKALEYVNQMENLDSQTAWNKKFWQGILD